MNEPIATVSRPCCGLPSSEKCRCRTDAAGIAKAIRVYVGRRARTAHDADDITQDALLRLYRSADRLEDERALDGWMYRIAHTAVIDFYRRAAVRPDSLDPERIEETAGAAAVAEERADASLAACLTTLLERLPESYREALELTDLGDLTQEAAADRLGLTTSGMKSRVQRGRRLLRSEVGKCCRIELDSRGSLSDASPRRDRC